MEAGSLPSPEPHVHRGVPGGGVLDTASAPLSAAPPRATRGRTGGKGNLCAIQGPSREVSQEACVPQGVRQFPHPAWGNGGEQRDSLPFWDLGRGSEGFPPPPPGEPVLSGFEKRCGPMQQPLPTAPLTEDDNEPHDEGQGSKDEAPVADSLIV